MARTFLKNLFCILSKNRANIFYQQEPCQLLWISKNTARMSMGVGGHRAAGKTDYPKYNKDDSDQSIRLNLKLKN
jgi:hypothetical protein